MALAIALTFVGRGRAEPTRIWISFRFRRYFRLRSASFYFARLRRCATALAKVPASPGRRLPILAAAPLTTSRRATALARAFTGETGLRARLPSFPATALARAFTDETGLRTRLPSFPATALASAFTDETGLRPRPPSRWATALANAFIADVGRRGVRSASRFAIALASLFTFLPLNWEGTIYFISKLLSGQHSTAG
jgi:hypothetical protein